MHLTAEKSVILLGITATVSPRRTKKLFF